MLKQSLARINTSKDRTLSTILDTKIIPIVRCSSERQAADAAKAIFRGGVRTIEVTMTVPHAIRVLEKIADELGDEIALGAGSVLDPETTRACMLAGAQFLVTPVLNLRTIEICRRYSKVVIPGGLTPTEVLTAWEAGADLVKIFPADLVGGPSYLRSLKAPLPQVLMVPTGGVTKENAAAFLEAGASAVGVGSSLVAQEALDTGNYDQIEEACRAFLRLINRKVERNNLNA